MVKKAALFLAVLMLFVQTSVLAGDLYSTNVRQVYCFSDLMRAYIDAEDSEGNAVTKPERSDIAAAIDGNKLTVQNVNRFGDTGEGVADIFLVDISGSIKNSQMKQVKTAINTWAENMKNNDRIAVITFGENVNCTVDFSNDRNYISNAVNSITNNDRKTQLYGGISEALKLATRTDANLPKRKNIILITDGVNDYNGGISENDVYTQLKESLIPVYSMWMPNAEKGRTILNTVTEYSGGKLYDMSNKDISTVYNWIRESIQNSYTVDLAYGNASADDGKHNLNVKVAKNSKVAEDNVQFTFRKSTEQSGNHALVNDEEEETSEEKKGLSVDKIVIIGGGALLLFLILLVVIIAAVVKKHSKKANVYSAEIYSNSTGNSYTADYPDGVYNNQNMNNNQNQQYPDYTMDVNDMGNGLTVVLTPLNGGAQLSAPLNGSISIGRGPLNQIVIDNDLISGRHCIITSENGAVYIEDLMSTNGTVVNGILINSKTQIRDNDTVLLGDIGYRISFVF